MHTNVRQQLYKRYAMVLHHPFILKVACLAKLPRVVTIHRLIQIYLQHVVCLCTVHAQAMVAIIRKKINKILIGIDID